MDGNLPKHRRDALAAELRRNDPRLVQRHIRLYLNYLDRHGSVARRLCESGARTWLVYGDHDEVGLTDTERAILDDCPRTTVRTIAGAGHLIPNTHPEAVAALIIQALRERPGQQTHSHDTRVVTGARRWAQVSQRRPADGV